MVSFDGFSLTDGIPIYKQFLLFLKREAVAGTIRDGDELPSRRVLSALLGVNPNTIQKAYRMLEEEGLIASHSGAKSLMVLNEETLRRVRGELLEADAKGVVNAMKQMGLTKEEALALIDQYWE